MMTKLYDLEKHRSGLVCSVLDWLKEKTCKICKICNTVIVFINGVDSAVSDHTIHKNLKSQLLFCWLNQHLISTYQTMCNVVNLPATACILTVSTLKVLVVKQLIFICQTWRSLSFCCVAT